MTAGFSPNFQPQIQTTYPQYAQMPAAAQPSYAQSPMPAKQPQIYRQTPQYPQSYPQGYYFPQSPGIINYVTPPAQTQQNTVRSQNAINPQALSHIPYEQNPLNMNNIQNNGMNAQMPAPNVQQGQGGQQMNAMNNQPQEQPFMDIGVVNAPENFSKTPIIDELNRRGQTMEKETPPKLRGKKTFTTGNVSAALSMGSLGIILTMALCKIVKLIKHK